MWTGFIYLWIVKSEEEEEEEEAVMNMVVNLQFP
jgi:hypothetical protein